MEYIHIVKHYYKQAACMCMFFLQILWNRNKIHQNKANLNALLTIGTHVARE
jgi:hypothetical protein